MTEDIEEKIAEEIESEYTDTSNTPIKVTPVEEEFDKETLLRYNDFGEVKQKLETLRDKGVVHFGTGSKGEVKAKGIDIQEASYKELKELVEKVAFAQTLMSKFKEQFEEMSIQDLLEDPAFDD